jgi:hypothetical protein
MMDYRTLLTEYVATGSEQAFRELVERCLNLVLGKIIEAVVFIIAMLH